MLPAVDHRAVVADRRRPLGRRLAVGGEESLVNQRPIAAQCKSCLALTRPTAIVRPALPDCRIAVFLDFGVATSIHDPA